MSEPLLRIQNNHTVACGDPPIVQSDDPQVYTGYFENRFGEQWIFTSDRETRCATLRGGDMGWNRSYSVRNGVVPELVLGKAESLWLYACWQAATDEA